MEISSRRPGLWQPWLKPSYLREERPKATSLHRKPSSAWRKERRRDPIQSEALDMSAARVHSRPSVIVPTTAAAQPGLDSPENHAEFLTGATTEDTAVTPTASVTPSAATRGQRTGMRQAGVASDPAIDEHFKRSLGLKDYAAVFNAATTDKETGLSVDDHFAKALGETWTRLQATSRSKDST
ncbi:transcription cofactor vestigial-like protein 4 isoform X2 [Nasonia vitripennis]|uniref:Transcription cofactor vestigial-like protein 4 n=1 Tax=Nasonia vitripennis TaxID=7425 RepID=A0A7M7T600_NASVI|nr:transcription cofactor vestigial-like protein 4 isoform X2 [Nasonia vitripennis]